MQTIFERGMTGARNRASLMPTRSPVVSNPLYIGSPASTTSSSSSTTPNWGSLPPEVNRAIFTAASLRSPLRPRLATSCRVHSSVHGRKRQAECLCLRDQAPPNPPHCPELGTGGHIRGRHADRVPAGIEQLLPPGDVATKRRKVESVNVPLVLEQRPKIR